MLKESNKRKKILFLTQTGLEGASARYRVYQFIDYLGKEGYDCTVSPAVSDRIIRKLTLRGNLLDRIIAYSQPLFRRISELVSLKKYDLIFLQRDILIHFPPLLELMISKINSNIIFDFDDALYTQPKPARYAPLYKLRGANKIPKLIKMADYVIVGNRHLKEYSCRFNKNTEIIPTSIDTNKYPVKIDYSAKGSVVIGWMGSPVTSIYLKGIEAALRRLAEKHEIILRVIGINNYDIKGVEVFAKEWNLDNEIEDLMSFDIGIMPLLQDEWTLGKCSTKLLQYMAMGIPVVSSAVGANCDIVEDGQNGFLAEDEDDWFDKIALLVENAELRKKVGLSGRATVESSYSLGASAPKLKAVLEKAYNKKILKTA